MIHCPVKPNLVLNSLDLGGDFSQFKILLMNGQVEEFRFSSNVCSSFILFCGQRTRELLGKKVLKKEK
jgi:NifU-like protein involved in Fe-S cluster formation